MFQICHAKTYSILPFSFKDKEHQLKIMMKNVSAVLTIINSPSVTVLCPRIWGCLGPKPSDLKKLLQSVTDLSFKLQKQPPRCAFFKKRCSENMQQIYRRTPMPMCDFNKVALQSAKSAWLLLFIQWLC